MPKEVPTTKLSAEFVLLGGSINFLLILIALYIGSEKESTQYTFHRYYEQTPMIVDLETGIVMVDETNSSSEGEALDFDFFTTKDVQIPSPDGKWIAYIKEDNLTDANDLFVKSLNGDQVFRLTFLTLNRGVDLIKWTSDSRFILFFDQYVDGPAVAMYAEAPYFTVHNLGESNPFSPTILAN